MSELMHLSDSRLKDARACQRLHMYRWILRRETVDLSEPLLFGSLWHHGQEAYWRMRKALQGPRQLAMGEESPSEASEGRDETLRLLDRDPLTHAVLEIRAYKLRPGETARSQELCEALKVQAEIMMVGYHLRWGKDTLRVLSVERRFESPLKNPETGAASRTWMMVGRLDVIVEEQTTSDRWKPLLMEHKSTTQDVEEGATYWRKLMMDSQISTYDAGCKALGIEVEGCLYDVAKRPGTKPIKMTPVHERKFTQGKECKCEHTPDCPKCMGTGWKEPPRLYANQRERDETLPEYRERLIGIYGNEEKDSGKLYQRGIVVRLEKEIREHSHSVWQTAQSLQTAMRLKMFPTNPDACERFNRLCDYFEVCTGKASIDDDMLFRDREGGGGDGIEIA